MLGRALKYRHVTSLAVALLASAGTAAAPVADRTAVSPVTNVGREQLENLPTGRSVQDLLKVCPARTIPTVSRQPQTLIDGVAASPAPSLTCLQPDDVRMIEVYNAHNVVRAEYGVSPLQWNPVLAGNAQTHANRLAEIGRLVHASREGRGTERENISQGLPGWSTGRHVASWLDERPYFRTGIFPDVSTTGDWYQVGHFSQMIWPTTTDIGCGMSTGSGFSWLVCRYDPGGNKDGKLVGHFQPQQIAQTPVPQQRASLFDLGIYSGGAWSTDWFGIEELQADPGLGMPCPLDYYDAFVFSTRTPATVSIPLDPIFVFTLSDATSVNLGVNNILDAPPPSSSGGSWAQYYDALGRYVFAGACLNF